MISVSCFSFLKASCSDLERFCVECLGFFNIFAVSLWMLLACFWEKVHSRFYVTNDICLWNFGAKFEPLDR